MFIGKAAMGSSLTSMFSGTKVFVFLEGIIKAKHALKKMHPVIKLTAAPQKGPLSTEDTDSHICF